MGNLNTIQDVKREFAREIREKIEEAKAEGRAEAAFGNSPELATAEAMAAKARLIQAANPTLTNLEAAKAAYAEAEVAQDLSPQKTNVPHKTNAPEKKVAACGSIHCNGCYDVGDGRKIHPPVNGSNLGFPQMR